MHRIGLGIRKSGIGAPIPLFGCVRYWVLESQPNSVGTPVRDKLTARPIQRSRPMYSLRIGEASRLASVPKILFREYEQATFLPSRSARRHRPGTLHRHVSHPPFLSLSSSHLAPPWPPSSPPSLPPGFPLPTPNPNLAERRRDVFDRRREVVEQLEEVERRSPLSSVRGGGQRWSSGWRWSTITASPDPNRPAQPPQIFADFCFADSN